MYKNGPSIPLSNFPKHVQEIIQAEAAAARLPVTWVLSRSQLREVAHCRFRIWRRQRNELTLANGERCSYPYIGRMWRHHWTTVISGVQRIDKLEPLG